jgi:HK97 family phage portal protein
MLLHGNAYVGLERDANGYATRAWLIDPRRVQVKTKGRGELSFEVDGVPWPHPDVLLHFPALVLNEDGLGLSPIAAAREAVGLAIAAEDAAAAWWSNAGVPGAVLQAASQLTDEQARRLLVRWSEMYSGPRKVGRVAVLDSGVEYKPLTISARDLQFLETRRFQVAEIARLFRVPPHMIADVERSTSWGTGIEQQTIAFVQYTLRPWIVRLEEVFSQDLLITRGLYVRFAIDGLLRGDTQSRWQAYRVAREIGVMSANEVRALEDLPRIESPMADQYFVPANWVGAGGDASDRETSTS